MTLEEAITHVEETAKKQREMASGFTFDTGYYSSCIRSAEEHEQLAEWLKELKELRKCKVRQENTNGRE